MAKISFTNLKLKTDTSTLSFKYGENEIEVLQYLPIDDKYDLIMITLQSADEGDIYNPIKLNMYFNLYLVFMYSNITFTEKQRENLSKLYDILDSNGIIDEVINLIPEGEYNQLLEFLSEAVDKRTEARRSITNILNKFVTDLPKQAEAMQDIIENFDPDKYQAVMDFAKAANGGRDIN